MRFFVRLVLILLVGPLSGFAQPAGVTPGDVSQQEADAAMARLLQRQSTSRRAVTSQPSPTTHPSANEISAPPQSDGFPEATHRRRDDLLSSYVHDFVRAQDDLNRLVASRFPKDYDGSRDDWAREKRNEATDLRQEIVRLKARAKAFEQLPMTDVAWLFDALDAKTLDAARTFHQLLLSHYRTVEEAGATVLSQMKNIQSSRFIDGTILDGQWQVTYVSEDDTVRSGKVAISFVEISGTDPKHTDLGFCPEKVGLSLPDGQWQQLEFVDPSPSHFKLEWDGSRSFDVARDDQHDK